MKHLIRIKNEIVSQSHSKSFKKFDIKFIFFKFLLKAVDFEKKHS